MNKDSENQNKSTSYSSKEINEKNEYKNNVSNDTSILAYATINMKEKRNESIDCVNEHVLRKWIYEKGKEKCNSCDEVVCHSKLYYSWIVSKYKNHSSMYRVPRQYMEMIVFNEYRTLRNFHQFIYERDIGVVKYPENPWKKIPIPCCIRNNLRAWVSSQIDEQFVDWSIEERRKKQLEKEIELERDNKTTHEHKKSRIECVSNYGKIMDKFSEDNNSRDIRFKYYEEWIEILFNSGNVEQNECIFCFRKY